MNPATSKVSGSSIYRDDILRYNFIAWAEFKINIYCEFSIER